MKTKLFIVFSSLFLFASCKKWLDLKPETQPTEEQILKTGDGYRAVLNGLYRSMGQASLYGKDLSFGMVDCISQQYKLDLTTTTAVYLQYKAAIQFNYRQTSLNTAINNTYLDGYNIIANANNLIQSIENASPDLFVRGDVEKSMILGEAYACRAMMHFDLLRVFAPALINDDGNTYLPYVDKYPNTVPVSIAVQPFLQRVVDDLELGRTMVAKWDTSLAGIGTIITGESRFYNVFNPGTEIYTNSGKYDDFFRGRGYHLNYYAIGAILARVYNYMGKHKEAFDHAEEVNNLTIKDGAGMQRAFSLDKYTGVQSNNWDTKNDLKTVSNLIFGVHNAKAVTELSLGIHFVREFYSGAIPTWFVLNKDAQKTFFTRQGVDESGYDVRSLYMIYLANGLHPISGKYFQSVTDDIRNKNSMVLPIIRSTELRYISAEYYARNNNFQMAKQVLTGIRTNRRSTEALTITNWDEFQEELIRDARREYISEGQLLYLYKRLNAPVNFGQNIVRPLTRSEYLLPIPTIQF